MSFAMLQNLQPKGLQNSMSRSYADRRSFYLLGCDVRYWATRHFGLMP